MAVRLNYLGRQVAITNGAEALKMISVIASDITAMAGDMSRMGSMVLRNDLRLENVARFTQQAVQRGGGLGGNAASSLLPLALLQRPQGRLPVPSIGPTVDTSEDEGQRLVLSPIDASNLPTAAIDTTATAGTSGSINVNNPNSGQRAGQSAVSVTAQTAANSANGSSGFWAQVTLGVWPIGQIPHVVHPPNGCGLAVKTVTQDGTGKVTANLEILGTPVAAVRTFSLVAVAQR